LVLPFRFPGVSLLGPSLVNRNFHTEIAKVAKIDLDWVTFRSSVISFPRVSLRGPSLVTGDRKDGIWIGSPFDPLTISFPRVSLRGSSLVTRFFTQRSQRSQRWDLNLVSFRSRDHFLLSGFSAWIVPRKPEFSHRDRKGRKDRFGLGHLSIPWSFRSLAFLSVDRLS
jgi:hypothetical protein